MTFPVQRLYHATRKENLDSILRDGLLTKHYGAVHGEMDYRPAGPSVYFSRHPQSSNVNTYLFDKGSAEIVVIEIDPTSLDPALCYPDDSMFYILDGDWLEEYEDVSPREQANIVNAFSLKYRIGLDLAQKIFDQAMELGEGHYPQILQPIWRELLSIEGEIAYLGDVPAAAILGWKPYDDPEIRPWIGQRKRGLETDVLGMEI